MEIEERRVLRRKIPLLEAYLRLNSSTVKSLRDQGLIDKETSRSILKLKTRREKIEHLVQTLDENATPTTFDKICYYLEKEFLDVIADEMQVELLLEKGKLPLAEYAVKEAKLLAYKLVADYEQLAEEDLENIASVLAGRYVIARETAKRQKARTMKEEDQDMKSIQEDVSQMYEELQGLFNPMLGFGIAEEEGGEAVESGLGFGGFSGTGLEAEPSIVISGSEAERSTVSDTQAMFGERSATTSSNSINYENNYSSGNKDLLAESDRGPIQYALSPNPEELRNGHAPPETPLPADAREGRDTKEQKKSFMKMLNERMKSLSEHLQTAVKNYHKLVRERNSCLEVLGVKPPQDANSNDVSLEEEIKKVIEETGYEPKTENNEERNDEGDYDGEDEKLNSKYSRTKNERQDDREINDVAEEEKDENLENETSTELKDKLKEERHKVEKLEEEVGYYKEQIEQMSKTRQMGYFYLSWYDEIMMNQALHQAPMPSLKPLGDTSNSFLQERPRSGRPPIALKRCDSGGAMRGRPASTGHSTYSARGPRGGTKWVYYNPDFLEVGDGYVTLKTDQLPNAWSRESTSAEPRTPPAEYRRGSPQGQSSRASNPTQGQSKRFNSPDFKLPYTGKSPNMTSTPVARGYVNGDFSSSGNRGSRGGKSVRIASGNNRIYNGVEGDSLNGDY